MLPARRSFETAMERLHRDIDHTFRRLGDWTGTHLGEWSSGYPCDIREEQDQIVVEAELPGFKKDQIAINVEQGVLTIDARREGKSEEDKASYHLSEREYAHVHRTFRLPNAVDEENVEAHLEEGVLTLVLPKREEAKARRIAIT